MDPTPAVLPCMTSVQFLQYVQAHHNEPTIMVMCCTRESLLEELCTSLSGMDLNEEGEHRQSRQLLVPTIHQLAISRTVDVAFVPTLANLRAYLATLRPKQGLEYQSRSQISSRSAPLLAIYGLLDLHRKTSEYSAQGLTRTLAIATEAATATGQRLVIAESPMETESTESFDATENADAIPHDPWKDQVPLLNGVARRFGSEDGVWAGRTVEAARVVNRWCTNLNPQMETNT